MQLNGLRHDNYTVQRNATVWSKTRGIQRINNILKILLLGNRETFLSRKKRKNVSCESYSRNIAGNDQNACDQKYT